MGSAFFIYRLGLAIFGTVRRARTVRAIRFGVGDPVGMIQETPWWGLVTGRVSFSSGRVIDPLAVASGFVTLSFRLLPDGESTKPFRAHWRDAGWPVGPDDATVRAVTEIRPSMHADFYMTARHMAPEAESVVFTFDYPETVFVRAHRPDTSSVWFQGVMGVGSIAPSPMTLVPGRYEVTAKLEGNYVGIGAVYLLTVPSAGDHVATPTLTVKPSNRRRWF